MDILFLTKASTSTGMGHLIRSRTLANQFFKVDSNISIEFKVIGESLVERLLSDVLYTYDIIPVEESCELIKQYDIVIIDMIHISNNLMNNVSRIAKLKVCISPIFNKMNQIDIFFNRTKYHNFIHPNAPEHIFASANYTIIQEDCRKIKTSTYEENLDLTHFPIAISMGGGDAANKTLNFLKSLKNCKVPATFWVMLGEGYTHSYDNLINEIKRDSRHEVILAKTNKSMWQILKNCLLAILPGGITTYEAAYAGLPTINLLETEESYFLIKELVEEKVCMYNGLINHENVESINDTIEHLYLNRKELLLMHLNSKNLIPEDSGSTIMEKCKAVLQSKSIQTKSAQ